MSNIFLHIGVFNFAFCDILLIKEEVFRLAKNRIRELRKEKNLTLKELSQRLKEKGTPLSASSLIKYERGERNPKLETWIKLADFFNVPVSYLQGFSDEKIYNSPIEFNNDLNEIINFLNQFDKDFSDSSLRKAEELMDKMEAKHGLDDFALLYLAMEKSSALSSKSEKNILNSLSKTQLKDIFDTISGVYSLAIEANGGAKIPQKYYKKIKQIYSSYLKEDMNDKIEKEDSSSKDDDLPF